MNTVTEAATFIHVFEPGADDWRAAAAAARHRRRRARSAAARPHGRAGREPAVAARTGAGGPMPRFFRRLAEGVFDEADLVGAHP